MNPRFAEIAERAFYIDDDRPRAFLLEILANIAQGIIVVDKDDTVDALSGAYRFMSGAGDLAVGQNFHDRLVLIAPKLGFNENEREAFYRRTQERVPFVEEVPFYGDGGLKRWMHVLYSPMPSGGFVLTLTDFTYRKNLEEHLRHQATHDFLTKLPNKLLFQDRVRMALAHAKRSNLTGCVLFLDLDNFKDVNDHYGHEIGDGLLVAVASRLSSVIREYDTVARSGGDEFLILLPEIKTDEGMENLLFRIQGTFWEPFQISGNQVKISMSLGVSRYPRDSFDMKELIRKADIAMYAAKQSGKNTWRFYDPAMKSLK